MRTRQFSSDWKTHWKYAKQIAIPVYLLSLRLLWGKFVSYLTWNEIKSFSRVNEMEHINIWYVFMCVQLYHWFSNGIFDWQQFPMSKTEVWFHSVFRLMFVLFYCLFVCLFVCLLRWCYGCYIRCTIRFIHPHWISHFKVVLICVSCKQCILRAQWREYTTTPIETWFPYETWNNERHCLTLFQLDLNVMPWIGKNK